VTDSDTDLADNPVQIAALQHWRYCPRQCALIHIEQAFAENLYTLRGQAVHARVDQPGFETRAGVRTERALPIWSERLGLIGKADVVEFEPDGTPHPIEYKHGPRRKSPRIAACDDIQLAAQAMCLEEMTGKSVAEGALFYASSKRRRVVPITPELRSNVKQAIQEVRALLAAGKLPPPVNDERCRACSLIELCQPEALTARAAQAEQRRQLFETED
jgi:CRISPR-associated exonuclease Cas4